MNSLYGRFGMDQYLLNSIIIDKDESILENLYTNNEIDNITELGDKLLIQYLPKDYKMNFYQENLEINISISIASSVTAYSRILMAKYKNTNQYKLHYTDTDSLYLSFDNIIKQKLFEASYVDPLELGYFKSRKS